MPECLSKTKFKKVKPVVPVDIYPDIVLAIIEDHAYDGYAIKTTAGDEFLVIDVPVIIIPDTGKYKISLDKEWVKKNQEGDKNNAGK